MSAPERTVDADVSSQAESAGSSRFLSLLLVGCCFLLVTLACFKQFISTPNWLESEADDFFYYLKIAMNLAHGHGSTFTPGIWTNGYHPLWLLVLTVACFFSRPGADLFLRWFLAVSVVAATASTYLLCRQLLKPFCKEPLLLAALALLPSLYAMRLYASGMEVILTIPLMLLLVSVLLAADLSQRASFWWSLRLGLLCSAVFLSRLDTIILLFLLGAGVLLHPRLRISIHISAFCAGLTPAVAYLAINQLVFGTLLPVSGSAKQLKVSHIPSWHPWQTISHSNLLFFLPILLGLCILPQVYKKLNPTQQIVFPVLLSFPFIYLFVVSCLSDWSLWPWYLYALRPALCVSFCVFLLFLPTATFLKLPAVTGVVALLVIPLLYQAQSTASNNGRDWMNVNQAKIMSFADNHHGIYAMGDQAGLVGYLLPYPLIQLEGLVMDKTYLEQVRAETPLTNIFKRYQVDYYVGVGALNAKGCFHAVEPSQAGPGSPHMTADLCMPAVDEWDTQEEHVFIFDVRGLR